MPKEKPKPGYSRVNLEDGRELARVDLPNTKALITQQAARNSHAAFPPSAGGREDSRLEARSSELSCCAPGSWAASLDVLAFKAVKSTCS